MARRSLYVVAEAKMPQDGSAPLAILLRYGRLAQRAAISVPGMWKKTRPIAVDVLPVAAPLRVEVRSADSDNLLASDQILLDDAFLDEVAKQPTARTVDSQSFGTFHLYFTFDHPADTNPENTRLVVSDAFFVHPELVEGVVIFIRATLNGKERRTGVVPAPGHWDDVLLWLAEEAKTDCQCSITIELVLVRTTGTEVSIGKATANADARFSGDVLLLDTEGSYAGVVVIEINGSTLPEAPAWRSPTDAMVSFDVVSATDLPKCDTIGWGDFYILASFNGVPKAKTGVKKGKKPKWTEKFSFAVPVEAVIHLTVHDSEVLQKDREVAAADLHISQLRHINEPLDIAVPLRANHGPAGTLQLRFYPQTRPSPLNISLESDVFQLRSAHGLLVAPETLVYVTLRKGDQWQWQSEKGVGPNPTWDDTFELVGSKDDEVLTTVFSSRGKDDVSFVGEAKLKLGCFSGAHPLAVALTHNAQDAGTVEFWSVQRPVRIEAPPSRRISKRVSFCDISALRTPPEEPNISFTSIPFAVETVEKTMAPPDEKAVLVSFIVAFSNVAQYDAVELILVCDAAHLHRNVVRRVVIKDDGKQAWQEGFLLLCLSPGDSVDVELRGHNRRSIDSQSHVSAGEVLATALATGRDGTPLGGCILTLPGTFPARTVPVPIKRQGSSIGTISLHCDYRNADYVLQESLTQPTGPPELDPFNVRLPAGSPDISPPDSPTTAPGSPHFLPLSPSLEALLQASAPTSSSSQSPELARPAEPPKADVSTSQPKAGVPKTLVLIAFLVTAVFIWVSGSTRPPLEALPNASVLLLGPQDELEDYAEYLFDYYNVTASATESLLNGTSTSQNRERFAHFLVTVPTNSCGSPPSWQPSESDLSAVTTLLTAARRVALVVQPPSFTCWEEFRRWNGTTAWWLDSAWRPFDALLRPPSNSLSRRLLHYVPDEPRPLWDLRGRTEILPGSPHPSIDAVCDMTEDPQCGVRDNKPENEREVW